MVTFAVSPVERTAYSGPLVSKHTINELREFKKEGCDTIVQATPTDALLAASASGFVRGAIQAYNTHHDLVLRPDDVWLAIMIQFGLYVNGNAEQLRSSLVRHEGQKELVVTRNGSLHTVDFGEMSVEMVDQMEKHLVDPTLKHWVLPSFSTTTDHDVIVGSVVMMASMKKYFSYKFRLCCGIPNVTLLGTVGDWEDIRARAAKLKTYGNAMIAWSEMLVPVLDQFVLAATGEPDVQFWTRICCNIGGGSGPRYISGWIGVFCAFDEDGKWQGGTKQVTTWGKVTTSEFPIINTNDIPPGYLTVDVTIDDNGTEYKALMFAGHTAFAVDKGTTIAPHLSWAIALKDGEPEKLGHFD
ncbi:hypothetical protein ACHHYP_16552 [Achlya hypogyna]|uniref:DUF4419 domain-containing protein n=1 Tax=Achlya hypogyna TaxID=1202772 RepID=A0A1V9ZED9_ACHHY|nr:hypothetical protein ACHHYP_16552 [Achlya hypogyna]